MSCCPPDTTHPSRRRRGQEVSWRVDTCHCYLEGTDEIVGTKCCSCDWDCGHLDDFGTDHCEKHFLRMSCLRTSHPSFCFYSSPGILARRKSRFLSAVVVFLASRNSSQQTWASLSRCLSHYWCSFSNQYLCVFMVVPHFLAWQRY